MGYWINRRLLQSNAMRVHPRRRARRQEFVRFPTFMRITTGTVCMSAVISGGAFSNSFTRGLVLMAVALPDCQALRAGRLRLGIPRPRDVCEALSRAAMRPRARPSNLPNEPVDLIALLPREIADALHWRNVAVPRIATLQHISFRQWGLPPSSMWPTSWCGHAFFSTPARRMRSMMNYCPRCPKGSHSSVATWHGCDAGL